MQSINDLIWLKLNYAFKWYMSSCVNETFAIFVQFFEGNGQRISGYTQVGLIIRHQMTFGVCSGNISLFSFREEKKYSPVLGSNSQSLAF